MSSSRRARRMARNNRRLEKVTKLNLVALMDIFTILVLFLIVNNGDVEVLQADNKVALPESVSEQRPKATLIVKVTATDILLDDRPVISVEEAMAAPDGSLTALAEALDAVPVAENEVADAENDAGRPITIMGDRDTPYALLKRVMSTCAETDYRDISMAVNSAPVTTIPTEETSLALSATLREGVL